MKPFLAGVFCVLYFLVGFFSAMVLLADLFRDWDPFYRGPYPSTLPAGYCMMTDGHRFAVSYPLGMGYTGRGVSNLYESKEYAIEIQWSVIESRRYDRHHQNPVPERPLRPVNPELCKTDK